MRQFCSEKCRTDYVINGAGDDPEADALYTYQVKCPVSGDPIHPQYWFAANGGFTVYFCTAECREEYSQEPARYRESLARQGIRLRNRS